MIKLAYIALKQEVTELSENFCGELSLLERGEGVLHVFWLCQNSGNTRKRGHKNHPRTSIAKTYEKE